MPNELKSELEPARMTSQIDSFGEQLRAIRLALKLTQIDVWLLSDDIAKREGTEDFIVSNTRLSAIEQGHALPGPAKLLALAEIYGLTREQLVKLWATINRGKEGQEAVQNTNND